jgi:predicted RNA-binding Zn-ribbon protein involved in translation (DUF1610 family)
MSTIHTVNTICPRCGHQIPNDKTPGAYMGAMSRKDNQTEVCSPCGTEEAILQFSGFDLDSEDWPIEPSTGR